MIEDPLVEAFAATGGSMRIGRVVTGGPEGEVRYLAVVGEGSVDYQPGPVDDADITLTDTYENSQAIAAGDLDPNAAFMRGQTKVTGSTGQILAVLACWRDRSAR